MTSTDVGNALSGDDSVTTTSTDNLTLSEDGSYAATGTTYQIQESDSSSTTSDQGLNVFSGADSLSTSASTTTSLTESGGNSAGSYALTETVTGSQNADQSGDDLTGSYTTGSTSSSTTTTQESDSGADGSSSSWTETSDASSTVSSSGDSLSGDYTSTTSGSSTTTLSDSGSDDQGSFTVSESDSGTSSSQETGNSISGSYSASTGSTDTYGMTESVTGSTDSYQVTESGTLTTTGSQTGNSVEQTYTTSQQGNDVYTLGETGNAGGGYTESVQGSEAYTLNETGDTPNQTFSRTEEGSGSYTLQDSGPGATLTPGSGTYVYDMQESGSSRGGSLSQTETGSDRYSLLQGFDNVSNAAKGTPGHLDYSPVGLPFRDPAPAPNAPANVWAAYNKGYEDGYAGDDEDPTDDDEDPTDVDTMSAEYFWYMEGYEDGQEDAELDWQDQHPAPKSTGDPLQDDLERIFGKGDLKAGDIGTYWGQSYDQAGREAAGVIVAMFVEVGEGLAQQFLGGYVEGKAAEFAGFLLQKGWRAVKNVSGKVIGLVQDGKALTKATMEKELKAAAKEFKMCFPAGTPVHTLGGLKVIEEVVPGDRVWAFDHQTVRWVDREVVEVYQLRHRGTMATLRVEGETLRATGGHPFWVVRGEGLAWRPLPGRISAYEVDGRQEGRWVLAGDLQVGDVLLLRHGSVATLESVRVDVVEEQVYNFQVAELQNYAVGSCGLLVHNTNGAHGVPAIRLRSGTTMAEVLQGVPDDAMIHLTRNPSVRPIVTSGGIEYGTSMVRAGDVRGMTLQQFKRDVVGPLAAGRAPDAKSFMIVHSSNPGYGSMQQWPRPNAPLPGTNVQEFRPTSSNIMPNDIVEVVGP